MPQVNVIHERATFHKQSQREGECVEEYVRSLFELSEHAQFAEKEETIRDRLVLGLQDQELSQKLQLETLSFSLSIEIYKLGTEKATSLLTKQ